MSWCFDGLEPQVNLFDWLSALGLQEYAEAFDREGIDNLGVLQELDESDLEKLGLKMGHRKRLLKTLRDQAYSTKAPGLPSPPPSGDAIASGAGMPPQVSSPFATVLEVAGSHGLSSGLSDSPNVPIRCLRLFLSYGRDEYVEEARALRDALRKRGHEVWFDEEQLAGGLDWEQRIEKGLAACDRMVLAMTPHSVRRPDGYCLNEIAKALELRKLIIPVLMVDVPQGAPTSICRIQYLDWRDAVPARERADRFARRLARLCEAIEEDKLDFEGGQQRLMRHLQPLNYDGDIQHHVARFRGRRQLETRLRAWVEDPVAPQRLWLTAAPGLGKSAVAAALAHRWGETGAVHFCVAGHHDKADPARAILSIAYQLATHLELYRIRLVSLDLERETEKDARTLFDTLLVGPLARDFPVPNKPWLVILDGLDEATRSDGSNTLAEVLASDWGRLPHWLRLLVSSRPEAEVQQWLAGTPTVELKGDDAEQRQDLADFVREQLAAAGCQPSERSVQRIVERSEGAFHYAVLLVDEVRQGRCDPEDPVDLPAGLNQIYQQSFRRRFPDLARYRQEFRPLLDLMLAAPEPAPLAVLAGAVSSSVFEVRQRLAQLGAMVVIELGPGESDPQWDTVRVSHASLRSWLTGLDNVTRLPLSGSFAATPQVKGLADEVLSLWEAAPLSGASQQQAQRQPKGFVARALWALLKSAGTLDALERVALPLAAYWKTRRLAWALEPAEFAADQSLRGLEARRSEENALSRAVESQDRLAEVYQALGRTAQCLKVRRTQLDLALRRSALDPSRLEWQLAVGKGQTELGEALEGQGDLEAALEAALAGVSQFDQLCAADPQNPACLEELGHSLSRAGITLQLKGDFARSLEIYQRNLGILEMLAAQDPDNTSWQFDLGRAHGLIGGILSAQGDVQGALLKHQAYCATFEKLTARDPTNESWLEDLGYSHHLIGGVMELLGDLEGSLREQRLFVSSAAQLCSRDPDNAAWQRDLALGQGRITTVLIAQGDLQQALESAHQAEFLFGQLLDRDPESAFVRRECAVARGNIARILWRLGHFAQALAACDRSVPLFDTLRREDTPSSLIDWAAIHALAAEICEAADDRDRLAHHESALIEAELPLQGVTGPFRRQLAPLILQRLQRLMGRSTAPERARLALRALRMAPEVPGAVPGSWRHQAEAVLSGLPQGCDGHAELAAEISQFQVH
jgi:tetratricopeptide (TPR) repeat protein